MPRAPLPLSLTDAIDVILPLASALAAAHAAGIVHRDVKPANIFLRGDRLADPCLVDFGVSKHAALDELTQSGTIVGSYPYFSPEHTRGAKQVTALSNLYSLAAVLFECVAGTPPFEGETAYELMHAIATKDVRPPSRVRASLPRELDEVIARAMDSDPLRRYPTMRAFGSALLGLASQRTWHLWSHEFTAVEPGRESLEHTVEEESASAPGASFPRTPQRRAVRPVQLLAPAVAIAVVAAAIVLFVHARRASPAQAEVHAQQGPSAPRATESPAPFATASVEARNGNGPAAATATPAAAPVSAPTPAPSHASRRPTTREVGAPPTAERGSNGVPIFD